AGGAPAGSPGHQWLFRLTAVVVLPLLLFVVLEGALRLVGCGYATGFFRKVRVGGEDFLVNNDAFTLRFFPPELARWPNTLKIRAAKPSDITRIFIFGESAAMGDPQPAYGAGRYLEVLLRERFPGRKFEIINTSITAINSHVILPIAKDVAARGQGDVWIVYIGNNEMVGPFGAATVFGSRAPPLFLARLNLAIQNTRVGQLATKWLRNLGGKSAYTSWGGMQMFLQNQVPPGDARKETVYRNFAANLREVVEAGLNSGARVVLSTMSVNLRDCPPFASLVNSNLPAADRERFTRLLTEGKALQQQSNFVAAAEQFTQATQVDPQLAEAHFRWAECMLQLSPATAREHFQRACDLDVLPFRADTRINEIIRELAQRHANERLGFSDAEAELARAGTSNVAGGESFYEHVHFNPEGNYRLGLAWAQQVERMLPPAAKEKSTGVWASQTACDQFLGLTIWNRHFLVQSVIQRMGLPPLSAQWNNTQRLKAVLAEDQELLRRQAEPGAVQRTRESFQTLIQASPEDPFLYEGLANFLEAIGEVKGAIAAYRKLNGLLPHGFYSCLQLGRLLGEEGQPEEAQSLLEDATRLRPSLPEGWYELGIVLAAQEKFGLALECMQRAERLRPQDAANVCYTGKVLAKLHRRPEAIERYRRAILLRPEYWEARFELASELAAANQVNEAIREYAEVLKLNPRHALTHVNLGVMLVRLNKLDEAILQFEAALRIEPGNRAAQDYLAQVQARAAKKP
ncbi:MAG: tetratricopeptide repeat protein, partial [Verrucomicrobia bacterium]|nr:tetratricopeptide repeat protein [Verrucomicrobiota bacterium]